MDREALFSDITGRFVNPESPKANQGVTISLRANKDDDISVFLCTDDSRIFMSPRHVSGRFSYYRCETKVSDTLFSYWFEIREKNSVVYYDRLGPSDEQRRDYAFKLMPGFEVPSWAKGAVMYQILVDRFAKGDPSTDVESGEYFYVNRLVKKVSDWDKEPEEFDVANFYGGDLAGVSEKLGYLKSLGIEVIYFNPLFVSPSNHKYDAQDYDYIDPHIGKIVSDGGELLKEGCKDNSKATKYIKRVTSKENLKASNEFFANFVENAHKHGIKVIIDGVFNHCGSFNKWLDREGIYRASGHYEPGAYWDEKSPYRSFFGFKEGSLWPKNKDYDGWWDFDTLPKLNYEESETLCEYILGIAKKWVSPPYNVDGWRLDVAEDLGHSTEYNHKFWQKFRKAVKEANPNAIILAEHYGDASPWISGGEWDTVMNYDAFMDPVTYFLTGTEKHSDSFDEDALGDGYRFEQSMKYAMARFMEGPLYTAMNQLSNHDHSRFMTRTNHKAGRLSDFGSEGAGEGINEAVFRQGVLMQMTWPGAPTLYYGDEAGVVGFTDPDSRRTYPWGKENTNLIDFYRDTISLHKSSRALRLGSFIFLCCERDFVAYGRFTDEEKIIIAINTGTEKIEKSIPVWKAEVPDFTTITRVMITTGFGYSILPQKMDVEWGTLKVAMDAQSGAAFRWS